MLLIFKKLNYYKNSPIYRIILNASLPYNSNGFPCFSFYRYVLNSELQFSKDGGSVVNNVARFSHLPQTPILTQNLHAPENWLVEVVKSVFDLDNIQLEKVNTGITR